MGSNRNKINTDVEAVGSGVKNVSEDMAKANKEIIEAVIEKGLKKLNEMNQQLLKDAKLYVRTAMETHSQVSNEPPLNLSKEKLEDLAEKYTEQFVSQYKKTEQAKVAYRQQTSPTQAKKQDKQIDSAQEETKETQKSRPRLG